MSFDWFEIPKIPKVNWRLFLVVAILLIIGWVVVSRDRDAPDTPTFTPTPTIPVEAQPARSGIVIMQTPSPLGAQATSCTPAIVADQSTNGQVVLRAVVDCEDNQVLQAQIVQNGTVISQYLPVEGMVTYTTNLVAGVNTFYFNVKLQNGQWVNSQPLTVLEEMKG